ncbi:hypothetical protein [Salinarimonas chemoclinalis]|uniref:hypothetical protein n=1 Tax=Salinarimonas chemoclinalis TaxID=3241599 RepID=UPI003555C2A0
MRVPLFTRREPVIVRLSASDVPARPPRVHKRQAHAPETVERVRSLVEGTIIPLREISERTGVDKGTISRWSARRGWTRPPGACRSALRPPEARYTPNRIGRALAQELLAACNRLVDAIVADPRPDPAALAEALDLLARARAENKIRRGRRLNPPANPPPRKRKPKRQPGDPPITRRSSRALRAALRTMQGLRPGDTIERELADQLRPPPPPRKGRLGR